MTDPTPATAATDPWSGYWATSRQGAIDLAADDPVAETLRRHWQAQAGWLQACHQILDVGSGNAVLPRWLIGNHPSAWRSTHWICLDSAELPDGAAAGLPDRVRLRGGIDFARSQPDAVVADAVVSNFGLEYVARDGVAAACARWLAPGGRLDVVVHARESIIDTVSSQSASDIAHALHEVGLFDAAAAMLQAMASVPRNPADPMDRMLHAVDVRDRYNAAVARLKQRMEARGARSPVLIDMLEGIRALASLVPQGRVDEALGLLAGRAQAYRAEAARLQAMQQSAQTREQVAALGQDLAAAGFDSLHLAELSCRLGPVAWQLSARRS